MEVLNEIFEFVSNGGHELKLSGGGSIQPEPVVVVSDMGLNEQLGPTSHRFDQRPVYRRFDIYRDSPLTFDVTASSIRVCPAGGTAEFSSPAFYSRQLLSHGPPHDVPSPFQLYVDNSPRNASNRFSAIPIPDMVSQVQFQRRDVTLSMDCFIAQANIYESRTISSNLQYYPYQAQQRLVGSVVIRRESWKRRYRVDIARYREGGGTPMVHILYWKGSMSAKSAVLGDKGNSNTDLKLVTASNPSRVVAVWNSGNESQRGAMGSLSIYESIDFNEEGILVELITSCLAVVTAERTSSSGLLDWLAI
ncbi:hypothetical protein BGW36DRAFT_431862 [Talaromyces proteolyticus]|uniref:Uncharacterized protein n=1 Tax=Talaromyces proteolyticus TaxID=1131652 RepID=A0AAD4PVF9_9EURO|nr:uncharacterized protein BGW36DRAFT_431862 [Talaromyces proteolyticus]KAH8691313.1 hypothetical protein BGW36DRAFT_431862 [Talaromyces proteolyticus]